MNKGFCKILVISNSIPNEDNATSITLKNIFSGWPENKLSIIYTSLDKVKGNTDWPVFHLSELKYLISSSNRSSTLLHDIRSARSEVNGVQGAASTHSFKLKIFNRIHTFASSYKAMLPYKYSKGLDDFITEFKPDVIYSPLGSIAIMQLAQKISDRFNLPVIPHFMDDWPHTIYEHNPLLIAPRLKKKYLLKQILKRSPRGIAISEKMAKEYQAEYHKEFFTLMNCVDIKEQSRLDQHSGERNIFSYFGGLHLLRWQTLKLFFEAVKKTGAHFSQNIEFRIYTSDAERSKYRREFEQIPEVIFKDKVSQEDLFEEMKKSDFLVHVEAFDEKIKQYTRLSISTKIPEYLAAQRPIFAMGPDDIASIEYLRDNDCAHVITDLNLAEMVVSTASKPENERLLANAWQLFLKNHKNKVQHELLKHVFQRSLVRKQKRAYS
jgi:hypothetical protein